MEKQLFLQQPLPKIYKVEKTFWESEDSGECSTSLGEGDLKVENLKT